MADMLVNLCNIPDWRDIVEKIEREENIRIFRAIGSDKFKIIRWVEKISTESAASECDIAFSRMPISCFIAEKDGEPIGYACYDATAPDFFGPTRVLDEYQGKGIGKALLLRALADMREKGYVYAIIGGVGPIDFYKKSVNAVLIENSTPGIYKDFLVRIKRENKV